MITGRSLTDRKMDALGLSFLPAQVVVGLSVKEILNDHK
jgi:hypothetical protein